MVNFKNLSLLEKAKFVLIIGDEGGILTYMKAGKLELRLFASFTSVNEMRNMQKILAEDVHAPIYVLVDVVDQSYTQQTLPAVSPLTINNLVRKRLERDFSPNDLRGSIFLDRVQQGRKDWHYIFVSCPVISPLSDWLQWIIELPNPFAGIHMLPVEAMNFMKQLNNHYFPAPKKSLFKKAKDDPADFHGAEKQKSAWQFLISHNKVGGGIRQIAFRNEKIIFTRLIATTDMMPEIIAGNIEQELLNSVEYLRRLSLKENEQYDVFILVSQEIKRSLEGSKLPADNCILLTPVEIAEQLQFANAATQEDRFADVILSVSFANQSHILPLFTPQAKKVAIMDAVLRWGKVAIGGITPLAVLYMGIIGYDIYAVKKEVVAAEKDKKMATVRWENFQKNNYSMEETYKISDVITLYKLLSGEGVSPLLLLKDFELVKGKEVLVKTIDWRIKESLPQASINLTKSPVVSIVFDVEFHNDDSGYDSLFENFSAFIEKLKNRFMQYDVEYSRLPEKISFDKKNSFLPVQITLTGPKELPEIKSP